MNQLLELIKKADCERYSPKIEYLLQEGADPNTVDHDLGPIPIIMIAISIKNFKLVKTLIKYGADVNYENTVLSRCMFDNFIEAFEMILYNENINKKSIEFALFSSLLREDRIHFTKMLLDHKKDICLKAQNAQGLNPLEFATKVKNTNAIEILQEFYF